MKIDFEQFEIIEAYLDGELSGTDAMDFEYQMKLDVTLAEVVEEQRKIKIGLRAIAIKRHLAALQARKKATIPIWKKYWPMAASILVFAGLGIGGANYFYSLKQYGLLYEENFKIDADNFTNKGFETDNYSFNLIEFTDALKSLKENNFDEAIVTLNSIPNAPNSIYIKKYYLGLSYLSKSKTSLAIQYFKFASTSTNSALKERAKWFLALAYLKDRDKTLAIEVLKGLKIKNGAYQKKAENLYRKLIE